MNKKGVLVLALIVIIGFSLGYGYSTKKSEEAPRIDHLDNMGEILLYDNGNPDAAIEAFEAYRKAIPSSFAAHIGLGWSHQFKQEYDKAIPYFEQALTLKPDHYSHHHGLGSSYLRTKQYEKAIEHYNKALPFAEQIGVVTSLTEIHAGLGWAYYNQGEYDKAIEAFTSVENPVPRLFRLVGMLATYSALNEKEKAQTLVPFIESYPIDQVLRNYNPYLEYSACVNNVYTVENIEKCGHLLVM